MSRKITLDPIMEQSELIIKPVRVESSIPAGFRIGWIDGKTEEIEFTLTAGAGVGSPYLVLTVNMPEGARQEVIDIRELVTLWVNDVIDKGPSPKVES